MKFKKLVALTIASVIACPFGALADSESVGIGMYVTYPDSQKEYEIASYEKPCEKDDVLMVPLRAVCEKLSSEVVWNEADGTATVIKREHSITPENFEIKGSRMYVPSDIIKDFFLVDVNYDKESQKVVFVTGAPYYSKWHKQENSQFKLELSTDEEYPSYLAEEVDNTVEDIKFIRSKETTSMAFITDIHYSPCKNDSLALTRAVNAYKDIAERVDIDGLVLGGDHLFEATREERFKALEDYRSHFEGTNYYPINGNHDNGYIWDTGYIKSSEKISHFDRPEIYDALYDHLPENGAVFNENDPKSLYYYVDNAEDKVRYIMLDGHSLVDEEGKNQNPEYDGVGQKQVDWLANEALKFDEEGWTVLVFMHKIQKPETSPTADIRCQYPLRLVLDTFKAGGKLNGTYPEGDMGIDTTLYPGLRVTCNYDFSNYVRADIAGIISGDSHHDWLEYSPGKIPYVYTAAFVVQDTTSLVKPVRADGTKSEILFDIITIDRADKRLYISRVGAGYDRGGIKY